jgi:hypothetical protein
MVEQNTLIIIGAVVVFCIIAFLLPWGGKCSCGESYSPPKNAQFTVNHPKYNVQPTYPVKSNIRREGFIVQTPTAAQTVTTSNISSGNLQSPKGNPFLGGWPDEFKWGTSAPSSNMVATLAGNGGSNPAAIDVWKTVASSPW